MRAMKMLTMKAIPCEEYDSRAVKRKLLTMILFAIFNRMVSAFIIYSVPCFKYQIYMGGQFCKG